MSSEWFENNLETIGHYENIYLQLSLDGAGKVIWVKDFSIQNFNNVFNKSVKVYPKIRKIAMDCIKVGRGEEVVKVAMEAQWEMLENLAREAVWWLDKIEELPYNADKRQRLSYKNSRRMERVMEIICDDVKEAKAVREEANEIIKEIARKAESPWEPEYFEDKNDPWDYKIGYSELVDGVCVEHRYWKVPGFNMD
jgi:hypothetical protein